MLTAAGCAPPKPRPQPDLAAELVTAARNDSTALITRLLNGGLPPDTVAPDGSRALVEAAHFGHADAVAVLLAADADPTLADHHGWRAIDYAVDSANAEIAAALTVQAARFAGASGDALTWFARVQADTGDDRDWSRVLDGELASLGLLYATIERRQDAVGALRRAAGVGNRLGYAPLDIAARFDEPRAVAALLAGGANPDLETTGPLHRSALMEAARTGDVAVARMLLHEGARVDHADGRGETALIRAARWGHTAFVRLLLDAGADPTLTNRAGETALHVAEQNKHADCARLLRAHPERETGLL